jgi:ABC-type multidrug transport system permease subunit
MTADATGLRTANLREAIYGTIVATAVIAATATVEPPGIILAETLATLLVFWAAHVYTDYVASRMHGHQPGFGALAAIMFRESAMLTAPALSLLFLLLGAMGPLDEDVAVRLALWNGVLQLVLWGIAVQRRLGRTWPAAAIGGAITGGFGLLIVGFEALLH